MLEQIDGIGLVLLSAGMLSLSMLQPGAAALDIVWRMALCGTGFGLFQSPNLNALMSSAPPQRAGSASAVIAIARLLGQTSGAALVALCFGLAGASEGAGGSDPKDSVVSYKETIVPVS